MKSYQFRNDPELPEKHPPRYFVCESLSERPDPERAGDIAAILDTADIFLSNGGEWLRIAPGKSR